MSLRVACYLVWVFLVLGSTIAKSNSQNSISTDTLKTSGQYLAVADSQVVIGSVILDGNIKTKDFIITREMYLTPGTVVTRNELAERLERDRQRIYNTQLFTTVGASIIPGDSSQVDIFIQVQERWYFVPNLIFKLADRNFNDWWTNQNRDLSRVNYGLRLKHGNFLGRAQKVAVQAQFGFTRNYRLNYINPYINRNQNTGLSFTYSFSENRAVAVKTVRNKQVFSSKPYIVRQGQTVSAVVTRRQSYNSLHLVGATYSHTNFADTILVENPEYVNGSKSKLEFLSIFYGFSHNKVDHVGYPLQGFYINASTDYLDQLPTSRPSLFSASATGAYFSDFGKKWYWNTLLHTRVSSLNDPPYTLQGSLGYGRNTVRGLELYVMEGQHHALSRNELKYEAFNKAFSLGQLMPFDQFREVPLRLYPKVYFDAAFAYRSTTSNGNDLLLNRAVWGTGFGLDIVSYYDFVLKLEYSFNDLGESGFFFHLNSGF
jgi:outer membrane protein assembly factor BamA